MNVLIESSVEDLVSLLNPKYNISVLSFKNAELIGDKIAKAYARCVDNNIDLVISSNEVVCRELKKLYIKTIYIGDNSWQDLE